MAAGIATILGALVALLALVLSPEAQGVLGNLSALVREHPSWVVFGLLLLSGIAGMPFLVRGRKPSLEDRLSPACRYVGLCERADFFELSGSRRQSVEYVQLRRRLLPVARLDSEPERQLSDDAQLYLQDRVGRSDWRSRLWGFWIEARPLLGKSRFVTEWLRHQRPKSLLIAPKTDGVEMLPEVEEDLRQLSQVDILLDDFDTFDDLAKSVKMIERLVGGLRQKEVDVLVWVIVRDGFSGTGLQSHCGALIEKLACVQLAPPEVDQLTEVASRLGRRLKASDKAGQDRSFGFLEEGSFRKMHQRFQDEIGATARQVLIAGAVWEKFGIPLALEKLSRFVVGSEFLSSNTEFRAGRDELRTFGFIVENQFERAYLSGEIISRELIEDWTLDRLMAVFVAENDLEALYFLGLHQFRLGEA